MADSSHLIQLMVSRLRSAHIIYRNPVNGSR